MKKISKQQWNDQILNSGDPAIKTQDWEILSSKMVYQNKFFKINENKINNSNQKGAIYYTLYKNGFFSISVPVEKDLKTTYLVGQYRFPVSRFSWEFPMGYVANCNPLEMAQGELREEAGIQAKNWDKLAEFNVAHGLSGQVAHAYLATDLSYGLTKREEGEIMLMKKVSLDDIEKMIEKGEIFDGVTISTFYFLKKFLKNK
jgi:hypothetical protein